MGEICDYNEQDYFSFIYSMTATPQSYKFQLWDIGIDYTLITPYQLFCTIYKSLDISKTSILFGDLDFSKFELMEKDTGDIVLFQLFQTNDGYEEVVIDEYTYTLIADYLCKSHFIEKDEKMPANSATKMILIEDARNEYHLNKDKPYTSFLKNLISSMVNSEGFKYNHHEIWDVKINAFMDSVKRISKIKESALLLQSGYSGYGIDLKKVNKKQLDWLGELS